MFKRMLSAFGVGGPSVDTVLDSPHATPGQVVTGQVRIQGGSADVEIGQVVLSLVTRVEVEHGDHEYGGVSEFLRVVVQQGVRVAAGQLVVDPVPAADPVGDPDHRGRRRPAARHDRGRADRARDRGRAGQGRPRPGPGAPAAVAGRACCNAFGQLGFSFRSADVEAGRLHGVPQELGFYQEIEFFPPAQFAGADQPGRADVRGEPARAVRDPGGRQARRHVLARAVTRSATSALSHQDAQGSRLGVVDQRVAGSGRGARRRHVRLRPAWSPRRSPPSRGPGMGTVVAAGAAGVVGGMVMGEMIEDVLRGLRRRVSARPTT